MGGGIGLPKRTDCGSDGVLHGYVCRETSPCGGTNARQSIGNQTELKSQSVAIEIQTSLEPIPLIHGSLNAIQ
jgi:hypothetical protein